jgi:hypothetical protein
MGRTDACINGMWEAEARVNAARVNEDPLFQTVAPVKTASSVVIEMHIFGLFPFMLARVRVH